MGRSTVSALSGALSVVIAAWIFSDPQVVDPWWSLFFWIPALLGIATGVRGARSGEQAALGILGALMSLVLFAALIWGTFELYR